MKDFQMKTVDKVTSFVCDLNLNVVLIGNFDVNVQESDGQTDQLRIRHFLKDEDVHLEFSNDGFVVKDVLRTHVDSSDFEATKQSIAQGAGLFKILMSTVGDILAVKNKLEYSDRKIEVDILLQRNAERGLSIRGDAMNVQFGDVRCGSVFVRSGNIKFSHGGLLSKSLTVIGGNMRARINFGENNSQIKIKSSNGSVILDKDANFEGLVSVSGNNVKVGEGVVAGNKNFGELNVRLNNGSVKLAK